MVAWIWTSIPHIDSMLCIQFTCADGRKKCDDFGTQGKSLLDNKYAMGRNLAVGTAQH
jgi:hypothetical protein